MSLSVLAMIKEEVTCPICLELLKDPVTADCNHIFCRACITLEYESSKGKEGEGVCPLCRVSFVFGNLRPNLHVANIVERLSGVKFNQEEEKKVNVCAQHGEKLLLFCEKDMVAICWLCERSQEHHGHQTALIEEVAKIYEGKLQAALERQMANEKRCDEWEEKLQEEKTFWENQIQSDIDNVQMEFKGLREFLDSEEKNELQKLMQEKEDVMKRLEESHHELMEQKQSVRDFISEVESQLECSTMEMLQGVNSVLTRSYTLTLKQPQIIPRKRRRIFRAPDLKGMLQVFQGLTDAQCYWVNLTLSRANNNLVINQDKGQIQNLNSYGRTLQISETYVLGVLACHSFQSGKHYWEVDVSGSKAWLLGVNDGNRAQPQLHALNNGIPINYNHNYERQRNYQPTSGYNFRPTNFQSNPGGTIHSAVIQQQVGYQPKHGYWIIGTWNKSVYNAFEECSVTKNAIVLTLSLAGPPSRVGIFLDREACTLSFYDVSNHGALIYRFYEPSFPNNIYPYFNPLESPGPMIVCGPPS